MEEKNQWAVKQACGRGVRRCGILPWSNDQQYGHIEIVPKPLTFALAMLVAAAVAVGAMSPDFRQAATGRMAFRIWRFLSPDAHGGHYVAINGIRLYYEIYGAGPPVLVLHQGLGSVEDMHHQILALARSQLVIAPDSRAHGRSGDSEAPLSYRLMADDMVKLLDALGLARVDIVGLSDGGIIGCEIVTRHPERIRRLVMIGANYDVEGPRDFPAPPADAPPAPLFTATSRPTLLIGQRSTGRSC